MTRHYLVGELSSLLSDLQPTSGELQVAVGNLRHEVEFSSPQKLPSLAEKALKLTDRACRSALEHGDATAFCRCLGTAIALRHFTSCAGLVP